MSNDKEFDSGEIEVDALPKKDKKKKTKEERGKDRKVVFWFLMLIVAVSLFFWFKRDKSNDVDNVNKEILENDKRPVNEEKDFSVKYKI